MLEKKIDYTFLFQITFFITHFSRCVHQVFIFNYFFNLKELINTKFLGPLENAGPAKNSPFRSPFSPGLFVGKRTGQIWRANSFNVSSLTKNRVFKHLKSIKRLFVFVRQQRHICKVTRL